MLRFLSRLEDRLAPVARSRRKSPPREVVILRRDGIDDPFDFDEEDEQAEPAPEPEPVNAEELRTSARSRLWPLMPEREADIAEQFEKQGFTRKLAGCSGR